MPLRLRKLTDRYASGTPTRKSERLYFGDSEIYREYAGDGTTVTLQRTTDHISDEHGRFAMQERTGTQILLRYNHADPLESSRLETDALGRLIAYEEYHAYGTTAYQATLTSLAPGARRYRYAGKERDEESGLYYFGARYYAPWLGRFLSVDPKAGEYIHQSTYCYAANNPVTLKDVNGEGPGGDDDDGPKKPVTPMSRVNNILWNPKPLKTPPNRADPPKSATSVPSPEIAPVDATRVAPPETKEITEPTGLDFDSYIRIQLTKLDNFFAGSGPEDHQVDSTFIAEEGNNYEKKNGTRVHGSSPIRALSSPEVDITDFLDAHDPTHPNTPNLTDALKTFRVPMKWLGEIGKGTEATEKMKAGTDIPIAVKETYEKLSAYYEAKPKNRFEPKTDTIYLRIFAGMIKPDSFYFDSSFKRPVRITYAK